MFFLLIGIYQLKAQSNVYVFKPKTDIIFASSSSLCLGFSLLKQKKIEQINPSLISNLNRKEVLKFDRFSTYQWSPKLSKVSDIVAISSVLMPISLMFDSKMRKDILPISNTTIQSMLLSQAICNSTKLTQRKRPFLYNEKLDFKDKTNRENNLSFFSGHTTWVSSLSFSTAFAYSTYHPNSQYKPIVLGTAFVLPAVQGYLRVKSGKHYPSDVIVAYIVGLGSSFLMHQIHLKKQ